MTPHHATRVTTSSAVECTMQIAWFFKRRTVWGTTQIAWVQRGRVYLQMGARFGGLFLRKAFARRNRCGLHAKGNARR